MKKLSTFIPAMLFAACIAIGQTSTSTTGNSTDAAEITFKNLTYDFGTVANGSKATYEFEFTNTGTSPLIISEVKSPCGCTTPSWPKEPLVASASGVIEVAYDTKRTGLATKKVTVMSNANTPTVVLTFTINVLPPSEEPEKEDAEPEASPTNTSLY